VYAAKQGVKGGGTDMIPAPIRFGRPVARMLHHIWHIPEGFATLVAGLLVIIAAAIAWWSVQRQIRATEKIEATKLRLNLYNRRYNIFDSIFDFYDALSGWKGAPEQLAAQRRFFRSSIEARFLFDDASGIAETLERLHKESGKVIGFKEHGKEYMEGGPQFYMEQFQKSNHVLLVDFEAALVKLKVELGKYLNFHTVRGD
jgi:hypothetical protein